MLLDQGSTLSFISETLCRTLRATRQCTDLRIRRFGKDCTGHERSKVIFGLTPCNQSKSLFALTVYVCKNLVLYTASVVRPPEWRPHLRGPPLKDPHPASGQPIHLLIGADLCGSLVMSDFRRGSLVTPTSQKTEPEWVMPGPVDVGSCIEFETHISHCVSECNADSSLRKSWADEKISAELTKSTVRYGNCASDWRLPHRYPN